MLVLIATSACAWSARPVHRIRAAHTLAASTDRTVPPIALADSADVPSWAALEELLPSSTAPQPLLYDAARVSTIGGAASEEPDWYKKSDLPVLYRERNGWCPYSERVWLTLELKSIEFATVLIDNTGPGPRPPGYSGSTPQMRWPGTQRPQGESFDLMKELDARFPDSPQLYPPPGVSLSDVQGAISAFKRCYPSNARPSSRAAYLFSWDGPLPRADFEAALDRTDKLLAASDGGPFFCGEQLSAADVAWAPFLERYAAQLPALHEGLEPKTTPDRWPHLHAWYAAMEQQAPAYACRVRGDFESWRRVLQMQGYGNLGRPPTLADMTEAAADPVVAVAWEAYAAEQAKGGRLVAPSAAEEAAAVLVRNREAVAADAAARKLAAADEVDLGLRAVAAMLAGDGSECAYVGGEARTAASLVATHLEKRVCVPRDMGAPSAASLRVLAAGLGE